MNRRLIYGAVAGFAGAGLVSGILVAGLREQPAEPVGAEAPAPPLPGERTTPRPPYHIPATELSEWLAAASPEEDALIKDGELTFEEYESAVLRSVQCIKNAGSTVVHSSGYGRSVAPAPGPRLSSRGVYSYFGSVPGTPDRRPTDAFAKIDDCVSLSAQVAFLWAQHTAPSEAELQAMRDYMAECLRHSGADFPLRQPSDAELREAVISEDVYVRCQFESADAFEFDRLPG